MPVRHKGGMVQIMLCKYCGEEGEDLALNRRIRTKELSYAEEQKLPDYYQEEPCKACKEKLDNGWLYFIADCQHSGFVKREALEQVVDPKAFATLTGKVFRMEKCFQCLGMYSDS